MIIFHNKNTLPDRHKQTNIAEQILIERQTNRHNEIEKKKESMRNNFEEAKIFKAARHGEEGRRRTKTKTKTRKKNESDIKELTSIRS